MDTKYDKRLRQIFMRPTWIVKITDLGKDETEDTEGSMEIGHDESTNEVEENQHPD